MNLSSSTIKQKTPIQKGAEKALSEKSLYWFFKLGWSQVDPAPFCDDWHYKILAEKLESPLCKQLIINIPPRCGKSLMCSVFFPVWLWIKDPRIKILTGSYADFLATRDTRRARELMASRWFQELWPDKIKFKPDQNTKTYYENTQKGERISFTVGGALTGSGGDLIIVDDPMKAKDADSEVMRENCNRWFSETLSTRINDAQSGRVIVIMQRLHDNDLTGYLLRQGGWEHICLPMEYEGDKHKYDIRKKKGEILTKRHSNESLTKLKKKLGIYGVASQLQQRPAPREGGVIKLNWLKYYKELPNIKKYVWSWDTAIKEDEKNDYSVGTYWGEAENGYYLIYMYRKKMAYPTLRDQLKILSRNFPASEILVEDKASGQQIIQELKVSTNLPIIGIMPGRKGDIPRNKYDRLYACSGLFQSGKVFLPENEAFIMDIQEELINFPSAIHDDIVDSISQYLCRQIAKPIFKVMTI